MTITTKPKKVEGFIEDISQTTVKVNGKTIYLPPDKRAQFTTQKYEIRECVRITYDRDGNYIGSDRLPQDKLPEENISEGDHVMGSGGGESHTQFEPEHNEIYIQQETTTGTKGLEGLNGSATGNATPPSKIENVHIQQSPQSEWLTEREKNDTIVIQSLLARAVDIVDAVSNKYPRKNIISEPTDFADDLDARINNIEFVTDRLFEYVKKKVEPDESKKTK
jgi:hypothetical protein